MDVLWSEIYRRNCRTSCVISPIQMEVCIKQLFLQSKEGADRKLTGRRDAGLTTTTLSLPL